MVLATGTLKHLRNLFGGRRVVLLGRPETAAVVAAHVDEFVPLRERDWGQIQERLAGPWHTVFGDLHLFYGGVLRLGPWLASLPARHKLHYAGYDEGPDLAPVRPAPRGFTVVPSRPRSRDDRHLLHDHVHYLCALAAEAAPERAHLLAGVDFRPELRIPAPELARASESGPGGEGSGDYLSCQPWSHNRKKDWPLGRWRELWQAFPEQRFVLLGGPGDGGRDSLPPNVEDRRGRTELPAAFARVAGARAHIGVDSALAHAATVLGRPTVVVAQDSNLGYFFPYPESYGFRNQVIVSHPDYLSCSGCFMVCRHEPIPLTWLRGALCVRRLPAAPVIEALRWTLGASRPS
jgi:hypothetical protein